LPIDRLHPAYWLARQASTGCELRDVTVIGQSPSDGSASIATVPNPPMQISAMRRPASTPARCIDARVDEARPERPLAHGKAQRWRVGDQAFDERRGKGVDAGKRGCQKAEQWSWARYA
jgi:hypothetical protein